MLECVPNVSEGRDEAVLAALAAACGDVLLDAHEDPDHHRSVFTLGAVDGGARTRAGVERLARAVAARVDVTRHTGVHPRLGALDVVPFVALGDTDPAVAIAAARDLAGWLASELAMPVFLYGDADPEGRDLPSVRREAFRDRGPDLGPRAPHPRLGATAVGARPPLVAVNVELDRDDLDAARAVAHDVRERDGGLPGVRALGFRLAVRGHAQVSMNLVDLSRTGLEAACGAVRERLAARGAGVARVELVGLAPAAEMARCSAAFLSWAGIDPTATVESRAATRVPPDPARHDDARPRPG